MKEAPPLLAPVFRSDNQARVLAALLLDGDEMSLTDLAKRAQVKYPTVHHEVAELVNAGILTQRRVGRTRLVRADPSSPLHAPLRSILLASMGPVPYLRRALHGIPGVQRAFLYGSFAARATGIAGPPPNDIDLMVIGTPDPAIIDSICADAEEPLGRPINATILTDMDLSGDSGFLRSLRENPIIPIIGGLE